MKTRNIRTAKRQSIIKNENITLERQILPLMEEDSKLWLNGYEYKVNVRESIDVDPDLNS